MFIRSLVISNAQSYTRDKIIEKKKKLHLSLNDSPKIYEENKNTSKNPLC